MSRAPQGDTHTLPTDVTRTEQVRRAAARLFEEQGYSATTMNDIATAVGVLPGSLYHHFPSKEDIAVDLLESLNEARSTLGKEALRHLSEGSVEPVELVRLLAEDAADLAFRHAAAGRLSFQETPTVATPRFTKAAQAESAVLERAWRRTVTALADTQPRPQADLSLLRYTLQRLTAEAFGYYPLTMDPRSLADNLCDSLFDGLIPDCPPNEELDHSPTAARAREAIAEWGEPPTPESTRGRDSILAVARQLFARRGYRATTIRDIAGAAGIPMATLYRRIESKESLLEELMSTHSNRIERAFEAVLSEPSETGELLDALALLFVTASRRFAEEFLVVRFGWNQREYDTSPLHDYYLATQRRLDRMEEVLASAIESGSMRPHGSARESALHVRATLWLPYHEHGRTTARRAHAFLRDSLLRGALRPH